VFPAAGGAVILDFTSKHFLPTIEVVVSKVQSWGIAVTLISTSFSGRNLPRPSTASETRPSTASETTCVNAAMTSAAVVPGATATLKTAVVDGVSVGCELGCELGWELGLALS